MKLKVLRYLSCLLAFAIESEAYAAPMKDEEVKGFAVCQAWSSAVLRSPHAFPEEWYGWAIGLTSAAVASPLNDDWSPLRDNALYKETLQLTREGFTKERTSAESPTYGRAYETCMNFVKQLQEKLKKN
jgi:hypothetical protein